MKTLLIAMTTLGLAGLSGAAVAQTASADLKGHKADFVVTPQPTGGSLTQDAIGSTKSDVIARVSRASPSVVNVSKTGAPEPTQP